MMGEYKLEDREGCGREEERESGKGQERSQRRQEMALAHCHNAYSLYRQRALLLLNSVVAAGAQVLPDSALYLEPSPPTHYRMKTSVREADRTGGVDQAEAAASTACAL